jgi:hypothetical protein
MDFDNSGDPIGSTLGSFFVEGFLDAAVASREGMQASAVAGVI